eukprot:TRINITY_DN12214_c0_g1_i1.p1 TRINITY_DN12214_c0_g1~~TRINITY_DN12214_c0_g1_i1.p1  ORF type:complete len:238 (+),score=32.95 TRINITY_DN12214_c0_g1_i1:23-715(+)
MGLQQLWLGCSIVSLLVASFSASASSKRLIVSQGGKEALTIDATSENETVIAAPSRLIVQGVDIVEMWRQVNETLQAQNQEIQQLRSKIPKISTFSAPGGSYIQQAALTLFWNVSYTPTAPNRTRLVEFTGRTLLYTDNYSCNLVITLVSPAVGNSSAVNATTSVTVCCNAQMEFAYPSIIIKDSRSDLPANTTTLTYAVYTNVGTACNWSGAQPSLTQINLKITEYIDD